MRDWHPLTRLMLLVALIAVPVALLLPDGEPAAVAVAQRAAPAPEIPDEETDVATPEAAAPATIASLDALTETIARPLFSPTRRPAPPPAPPPVAIVEAPPPAPVVEAPPPPLPRTDFVASGIVVGPEGALVVLRPRGGGVSVIAREGDEVGGWRVERIEPTAVHLSSPDGGADHVLFAPRQ